MGYMAHEAVLVTVSDYVLGRTGPPLMPDVDAFRQSLPEEWRPLVIGPSITGPVDVAEADQ